MLVALQSTSVFLREKAVHRPFPHAAARYVVQHAQIVLACPEAESHMVIAKRLGVSHVTVGKWRRRFHHQEIEGLQDEQRPGRSRTHGDERVAEVINTALQSPPANANHWSVRTLAACTGISKSTVHRWFQLFHLQSHGHRNFKLSNDPYFVDKVHDSTL